MHLVIVHALGPRLPHLSQGKSHFCTPWLPAEHRQRTAAELGFFSANLPLAETYISLWY